MSKTIRSVRSVKPRNIYNVALERVLGFTATNNCSIALDTKNSTVFYTAGCVVVGESCISNFQFIVQSPSRKSLTCLDVSSDGKYIITGESGHQPMVRVWSRADGHQLGALASHHFRISSVRFSPGPATYIISVGCQEDQTICVWDRTQFQKVACAKVSAKVNAVAFANDGEYFVTVGIRHVRFWYLEEKKRSKVKETQPLKGRNAVLGDILHNTFTDVCCCLDPGESGGVPKILTLVLSQAGQLLQINSSRCVTKWVDLKVTNAACLALSRQVVAVGCASGVCLLFSAVTLRFITRVPLPHPLGACIASSKIGTPFSAPGSGDDVSFAEVAAIKFDLNKGLLICMYADHSLYCWDVSNLKSITRRFAHFYHSRAVCGGSITSTSSATSTLLSTPDETDLGRWAPATDPAVSSLHVEHFATCSDDDTVRIWTFPVNRSTLKGVELFPDGMEEVSILYTDSKYTNLCSDERLTNGFGPSYFGQGSMLNFSAPGSPSPLRQVSSYRWNSNANIAVHQNGAGYGLRSLVISPHARHLAVGNRSGQLMIYDFNTFKLLHSIRAHDAEILSITYFESKLIPGMSLLCTSSRDRVIHVFAPQQDYSRVQTLADHSGIVNSALFYECEENRSIYLISCGADRSLLFRILSTDPESQTARFVIEHHVSVTHSYACATVVGPSILSPPSPAGGVTRVRTRARHYLAVACQGRQLRLYQITKARQLFHYRASTSEDGSPVCCAADPTSTLIATAGSDKQINLFHLFTGEHVTTLYGHADIVMGLIFLPDLRHLVSLSCDSCIFIWRLPPELTALMQDRQQRIAAALANTLSVESPSLESPSLLNGSPISSSNGLESKSLVESTEFCSNEADLPSWAREKQQHPNSDTEPSRHKRTTLGRTAKRSLTTDLSNPVTAAAVAAMPHVSRSNSDLKRTLLASRRLRNHTGGNRLSEYLSRGGSLSRLSSASRGRRDGGGVESDVEGILNRSPSPKMASSAIFPRWASSVVDVNEESPFEPPPVDRNNQSPDLIETNLSLTTSLSTDILSNIDDLPIKHHSNNGLMSRSQIDDYCPKLSRVEELYDNEMDLLTHESAPQKRPNALTIRGKTSARASWLEQDAEGVTSARNQEDDLPLTEEPVVFRHPHSTMTHSRSSDDSLVNPVSSTSESVSALSLLYSVREALDAAVEQLATTDDNAISDSREFFRTHLEWRVSRLRNILRVEPPISSSIHSGISSTTIEQQQNVEGTAVVNQLIERLMPSIRTAMTETLTATATSEQVADRKSLKVSADPLPAE
nr:mitogen activated protein kinase binding protein [Hymenolepis microstoma]